MVDIGHEETELILRETEREVRQVYLRAQSETQAKLDDYLSRFATKDAIKKRQLKEGKITQAEYRKWRKGQVCIGKRWQEMVDTLSQDYVNADKLAMSIVRGHTPEAYALNHNYATFQIERDSWVNTSYTLYDRQTVERLIRDNPDLLPRPKVDIPADKRWNKTHIKNEITQGILQGEDLRQVSKRLQKVTDMDNRAAMRNARTAMTGAQNAGRVDAYKRAKAMGIRVEQEWLATLDGRTRHSHRQMDGQHVEVGEKFGNGCRFPGDPEGPPWEVYNCRCTLVPRIAGVDQSDAPRDSRLGGMTYEEWKNERVKAAASTETGYEYGKKHLFPIFDKSGDMHEYTFVVEKVQGYGFPDGTGGGVHSHRDADVFTMEDGTQMVFPSQMDTTRQTLTPDILIRQWYQLPEDYRKAIQKRIIVCDYRNPKDEYWAKTYNMPGFKSYMVGGEKITIWEYTYEHDEEYFVKSLAHEGGHYIDRFRADSVSRSRMWADAVSADLRDTGFDYPSDYARKTARNNPGYFVEDFADSCAEYITDHDFFVRNFPHRAAIIKDILSRV